MWVVTRCDEFQCFHNVFPSSLQSELVPSCTQASAQRLAECGQYYDAVPRQNFGSPRYNTGAVWWQLVLLCIIVLCKCVCFVCVSWIYRDGHWWPLHSVYISQHIACLHNFAYHVYLRFKKILPQASAKFSPPFATGLSYANHSSWALTWLSCP